MTERQEYLDKLPKKRMGSGVLLFNDKNELLIVKPTYREGWIIPGGTVEKNESPRAACIREAKEEVGLDIKDVKFICLDYRINDEGENLQFLFYGGIVAENQIGDIKLQESELSDFKFVGLGNMEKYLIPSLAKRIFKCIDAIKNNKPIYLENEEYV